MKSLLSLLSTSFVMIAVGCALSMQIKKSPSTEFLAYIKSNDEKNVLYSFESRLPDPFPAFDKKDALVDLNASFSSNLEYYMNNKFSIVNSGEGYEINFILKDCNMEYRGAVTVSVKMNVEVSVRTDNKIIRKEIVALSEYNGTSDFQLTTEGSLNAAVEKTLLLIDKHLDNVLE